MTKIGFGCELIKSMESPLLTGGCTLCVKSHSYRSYLVY